MMRTSIKAMLTAVCLTVPGAALGTTVEAKQANVQVLSEAKKGSAVVATIGKGQTLETIERKGMYWQVKTSDGKPGFVSVLHVKRSKVETSSLSKALREATKDEREGDDVSGARSRSAVMGVRGLGEDDDTAMAGDARPNLRAVYAMEDYTVSEEALEKQGEIVFAEIEMLAN